MPFVRITIARPTLELRDRVRDTFRDLLTTSAKLPGYVGGYLLESPDASGAVGRVTIWASHELADAAANDQRILAVHSELLFDNRGTLQDWDLDGAAIEPSPSSAVTG